MLSHICKCLFNILFFFHCIQGEEGKHGLNKAEEPHGIETKVLKLGDELQSGKDSILEGATKSPKRLSTSGLNITHCEDPGKTDISSPSTSDGEDPLKIAYQGGIGVDDAIICLLNKAYSYPNTSSRTVCVMFFIFSSDFHTI